MTTYEELLRIEFVCDVVAWRQADFLKRSRRLVACGWLRRRT